MFFIVFMNLLFYIWFNELLFTYIFWISLSCTEIVIIKFFTHINVEIIFCEWWFWCGFLWILGCIPVWWGRGESKHHGEILHHRFQHPATDQRGHWHRQGRPEEGQCHGGRISDNGWVASSTLKLDCIWYSPYHRGKISDNGWVASSTLKLDCIWYIPYPRGEDLRQWVGGKLYSKARLCIKFSIEEVSMGKSFFCK